MHVCVCVYSVTRKFLAYTLTASRRRVKGLIVGDKSRRVITPTTVGWAVRRRSSRDPGAGILFFRSLARTWKMTVTRDGDDDDDNDNDDTSGRRFYVTVFLDRALSR